MRRIDDRSGNTLHWVQPRAMSRQFELRQDGDVVATLKFGTSNGSLARVETADGAYTFKRVGFFRPEVTIRRAGAGEDLGRFSPSWNGGGTVALADGVYGFKCSSFWASLWTMSRAGGEPAVSFKLNSGLLKLGAQVTFGAPCAGRALLALLGGYLMVLMADDAAVTRAEALTPLPVIAKVKHQKQKRQAVQ
jgi:hypothetical protein